MSEIARRYIELLKKSLVNDLYVENEARLLGVVGSLANDVQLTPDYVYSLGNHPILLNALEEAKATGDTLYLTGKTADGGSKWDGGLRNFSEFAHTLIGRKRLDNIQYCVEAVLADRVPGDLIETGIWRGGAVIFMRGLLAAHEVIDRVVWGADSFEGVPPPSAPEDAGLDLSKAKFPFLAVRQEQVEELCRRYGLLDDQVKFLKGWFKDTLPGAPIRSLAVLRLDGDLYESTMDALVPLYPKLSSGGFVIIDDYCLEPCRRAVEEYRRTHGITEEIVAIDRQSVFWRKS